MLILDDNFNGISTKQHLNCFALKSVTKGFADMFYFSNL